jgi:hypothetical protein
MKLAVLYSWFPFLGTRGEHTWCSRATRNSWKHDVEVETEVESSGTLEFARQALCSFFALKTDHLSDLTRSWHCGNCRDGDSCKWAMTTISVVRTLRARGSRGRSHLLLRHLLCGFGVPGSAAFPPVGLGHSCRLGNKLTVIARL